MMRIAILGLIGILLFSSCTSAPTQPAATSQPSSAFGFTSQGWKLVWADEFDGTTIDPRNWTFDLGGGGWGNSEWETYTNQPSNARLENGMLIIEARHDGSEYTSARLKTQGLQEFQYGRVEARIKLPPGKGLWSAFWMLGSDYGKTTGWPNCGEIDILEYGPGRLPGNSREAADYASGKLAYDVFQTVHGPGYSGSKSIGSLYNLSSNSLANDFHVYAVEWQQDAIHWFVDGNQVFQLTPDQIPAGTTWAFNHSFFILMNLAIGGSFGMPSSDTVFPEQMLIDYVRVYQKQ